MVFYLSVVHLKKDFNVTKMALWVEKNKFQLFYVLSFLQLELLILQFLMSIKLTEMFFFKLQVYTFILAVDQAIYLFIFMICLSYCFNELLRHGKEIPAVFYS